MRWTFVALGCNGLIATPVYWVSSKNVMKVPIAGGAPVVLAPTIGSVPSPSTRPTSTGAWGTATERPMGRSAADEGCPTSVRVSDDGDAGSFPDLTRCVASALSTQRWSCGDASAVDYLWFINCTN